MGEARFLKLMGLILVLYTALPGGSELREIGAIVAASIFMVGGAIVRQMEPATPPRGEG